MREEFIAELLELIPEYGEANPEEIQKVRETMTAVEALPARFKEKYENWDQPDSWLDPFIADLRNATEEMIGTVEGLPDNMQVEVADFIEERYLDWGLHSSLDHA